MGNDKNLFMVTYSLEKKKYGFLGSDGLTISHSYNVYLKKHAEFKAKARKYAQNNLYLKNSLLHHNILGYKSAERFEEKLLLEREEQKADYIKAFDMSQFDEDSNSMYGCFVGQSKRIRVIREIKRDKDGTFSEDMDKENVCWFTRYCALSRFIHAARMIIIQNRLLKILAIFKTLTPEMIIRIENEMIQDRGEKVKIIYEGKDERKESLSKREIPLCNCAG